MVVAVRAPSRLAIVLNLLRHYAGQSPEWRARSYGGWAAAGPATDFERRKLGELMADLAERLPTLSPRDAYGAWWSEGFTLGTQGQYPMDDSFRSLHASAQFIRSLRSRRERPASTNCIVRSGPTDRPQAETVLGDQRRRPPVVDWVLQTHAAFSVEDACQAFGGCSRDDLEKFFAWLSHAALIRPLPAPEWDRTP